MTVDRVQVLATPGMDRHGAYVAMSRHRESVDLHYRREDFRDQSKLVRTLGRDRGKDMASDSLVRVPATPTTAEPKPAMFDRRKLPSQRQTLAVGPTKRTGQRTP